MDVGFVVVVCACPRPNFHLPCHLHRLRFRHRHRRVRPCLLRRLRRKGRKVTRTRSWTSSRARRRHPYLRHRRRRRRHRNCRRCRHRRHHRHHRHRLPRPHPRPRNRHRHRHRPRPCHHVSLRPLGHSSSLRVARRPCSPCLVRSSCWGLCSLATLSYSCARATTSRQPRMHAWRRCWSECRLARPVSRRARRHGHGRRIGGSLAAGRAATDS
jgi:hypothetical protein